MYLSNYLLNNGNSYQFFLNLSSGASERKSHVVFLEGCERSSMAEQRTGAFQNQYKFNDYGVKGFAKTFYEHTARSAELDEETGYYYYGARYYNPQISRWLSVGPLAEKTMDSYGDAYNNSIKLINAGLEYSGQIQKGQYIFKDSKGKVRDAYNLVSQKVSGHWHKWGFDKSGQRYSNNAGKVVEYNSTAAHIPIR